jgi:hypothetical protein
MWASGHNGDIKRAAHGYEAAREAAMQLFLRAGAEARGHGFACAPVQFGLIHSASAALNGHLLQWPLNRLSATDPVSTSKQLLGPTLTPAWACLPAEQEQVFVGEP